MDTANRNSLRSRLQAGVTWNFAGAVFTMGGNFVTNIIIANILGRDVFGEYGMVQSTVVTISGVAQLATGFTATKYVAENRAHDKEKTGRIMGLCSVLSSIAAFVAAAALLIGASWLAGHAEGPHMREGLMITAGLFFFCFEWIPDGCACRFRELPGFGGCAMVHGCVSVGIVTLSAWLWGFEGHWPRWRSDRSSGGISSTGR
jgi:hypothetical protein